MCIIYKLCMKHWERSIKMSKDKAIKKAWIRKEIHEKAVKRYENEVNQAYDQLKDSWGGELSVKNPPEGWQRSPLKPNNEYYCYLKEKIFSSIFKGYDDFKKKKIAEYEQEETDAFLNLAKGIPFMNVDNN